MLSVRNLKRKNTISFMNNKRANFKVLQKQNTNILEDSLQTQSEQHRDWMSLRSFIIIELESTRLIDFFTIRLL